MLSLFQSFLLFGLFQARASNVLPLAFVVLLALRVLVWSRYRKSVDASLAARARSALDLAGRRLLIVGTIVPLILLIISWLLAARAQPPLLAIAGACAAWAGGYLKYIMVTRASFNQGFALSKMPVRGVKT